MLRLRRGALEQMIAHSLDGYPLEACGLLVGPQVRADGGGGERENGGVERVVPTANASESSRVYAVEPRQILSADRDAEADGLELIGVFHSHTHTAPYPSPTDVEQAPDPTWHYLLISLADTEPEARSFRIVAGKITEEPVVLLDDDTDLD